MGSTGSLLGKGLAFPLRMDLTTGDFQRVIDEDNVDQCLRTLIFTQVGERLDPLVGTAVPEMIFEDSDVIEDLCQPSILAAIRRNEPRVQLISLKISTKEIGGATSVVIALSYVVRATNQRRNRVWPYAIPESKQR